MYSEFNINKINTSIIKLESELSNSIKEEIYAKNIINFLSSSNNAKLETNLDKIIKNVNSSNKKLSSYISTAIFLTDLYLNIRDFGEHYFKREKLQFKINIALSDDLFYNNINKQSISIDSDIDRRAILIKFRSKNPTVHKVATLIVKDFEMRLSKFEDSFKEINLKLYYILPRIKAESYDLENYNFDAYIPTLLPLLTGDNLYKQKEVFLRELVQNSIDAIQLRKKLQSEVAFDTSITIEFGEALQANKLRKYIRISDNGVGMTRFTIERYFTSIGRSFYVSEEFDDIKRENGINYQAISNFGIGFLSSFMVCREILVETKSIFDENLLKMSMERK
jgi:hypothetical protein